MHTTKRQLRQNAIKKRYDRHTRSLSELNIEMKTGQNN